MLPAVGRNWQLIYPNFDAQTNTFQLRFQTGQIFEENANERRNALGWTLCQQQQRTHNLPSFINQSSLLAYHRSLHLSLSPWTPLSLPPLSRRDQHTGSCFKNVRIESSCCLKETEKKRRERRWHNCTTWQNLFLGQKEFILYQNQCRIRSTFFILVTYAQVQ